MPLCLVYLFLVAWPWALPSPARWIVGPLWVLLVVIPGTVARISKVRGSARPRRPDMSQARRALAEVQRARQAATGPGMTGRDFWAN